MPDLNDSQSEPVIIDTPSAAKLVAAVKPKIPTSPTKATASGTIPIAAERFSIQIVSSETVGDELIYDVNLCVPGGDTSSGLVPLVDQTYKARNVADDSGAGDPLADETVILDAWWSGTADASVILFDANAAESLPEAEHQYMVLTRVSDNAWGADYHRAHPILSGDDELGP